MPLDDGLRLEQHLFQPLSATEDSSEGTKAFAEKREPSGGDGKQGDRQVVLQDAYLYDFEATVIDIQENRVGFLDRTAYVTGVGNLAIEAPLNGTEESFVSDVKTVDGKVWHFLEETFRGSDHRQRFLDRQRRHKLMRTHSNAHSVRGDVAAVGEGVTGNMDELSGRMDFELDEFPDGFAEQIENRVTQKLTPIDKLRSHFGTIKLSWTEI